MKKMKEKLNNRKRIIIILLFAIFANYNLLAVDVAPRISDKEIVQSLADIKSEFKVVYGTIDNLRKEIKSEFKAVYTKIDNLEKNIDLKFDKVYAQMDGNKRELQAQIVDVKNELSAKFNLLIMFIGGFLLFGISAFIGIAWSHIKVLLPLKEKVESHKEQLEKYFELSKKLAEDDIKVRKLLQQCNLL